MLRDFTVLTPEQSAAALQVWRDRQAERRSWWPAEASGDWAATSAWLEQAAEQEGWAALAGRASKDLPEWFDPALAGDPVLAGRAWACDLVAEVLGERLVARAPGRAWGVIPLLDEAVPDARHRWGVITGNGRGYADVLLPAMAAVSKAGRVRRETLAPAFATWSGMLDAAERDAAPAPRGPALGWTRNGGGGHWQVSVPGEAAHLQPGRVQGLVAWLQQQPGVRDAYGEDRERVNVELQVGSARRLKKDAEAWWAAQPGG